jgi:hypothetical protein
MASVLCPELHNCRSKLYLLSAAQAGNFRKLEAKNAGRVFVGCQGEPVYHTYQAFKGYR